jgi:hypothetical protein
MSPKDDYRLLVVDNLKNAKELKLVVRTLALPGSWTRFYWYDPTFYR